MKNENFSISLRLLEIRLSILCLALFRNFTGIFKLSDNPVFVAKDPRAYDSASVCDSRTVQQLMIAPHTRYSSDVTVSAAPRSGSSR
jgi:hypothetical protein